MTNVVNQIHDLMQEDALQYTFGKEALKRLLEELETLEREKDEFGKSCSQLTQQLADSAELLRLNEKEILELGNQVLKYKEQEAAMVEREKKCLTLEIRNEFEGKRSEDLKETLGMLLRNTEYRKSVFQTLPVSVAGAAISDNGVMGVGGHVEQHDSNTTYTEEER